MKTRVRKLDIKSLNLSAILGNSDKAASENGLTERGADKFLGSSYNSYNSPQRRFFRKEAGFISR